MEGLPPRAIEKDWWVTKVLGILFSLPFADYLVFKGGTSLSKGWDLIERFSEDIDIALDRDFLGFSGELSNNQVRNLKKASCKFISGHFFNCLEEKVKELKVPGLRLFIPDFTVSDKDPLSIELHYPSLTTGNPYLKPRVLIEISARSLRNPFESRSIRSLVGSAYPKQPFADQPIQVPSVLPQRTLLEKAFLLHEEFQKPQNEMRVKRLSRHLYDLEKLMDTPHLDRALKDPKLFTSIVTHRKKFNRVRRISYDQHLPKLINFIPPAGVISQWEHDYKEMQQSMIYGPSKNFKQLLKRMETLQQQFQKIAA